MTQNKRQPLMKFASILLACTITIGAPGAPGTALITIENLILSPKNAGVAIETDKTVKDAAPFSVMVEGPDCNLTLRLTNSSPELFDETEHSSPVAR